MHVSAGLTLAGFLLLQALCLRPILCLAAELSRQPTGLAGSLKSPGTTRGLTALLEAPQDSWEDESLSKCSHRELVSWWKCIQRPIPSPDAHSSLCTLFPTVLTLNKRLKARSAEEVGESEPSCTNISWPYLQDPHSSAKTSHSYSSHSTTHEFWIWELFHIFWSTGLWSDQISCSLFELVEMFQR